MASSAETNEEEMAEIGPLIRQVMEHAIPLGYHSSSRGQDNRPTLTREGYGLPSPRAPIAGVMIRIGVTGAMASGKSTLARRFREAGGGSSTATRSAGSLRLPKCGRRRGLGEDVITAREKWIAVGWGRSCSRTRTG
jgi:hypothetical protein